MKHICIYLIRILSVMLILMMTSVAYAQETPAGRAVTQDDWKDYFPVLGLIVVFTLVVTAVFFYLAFRNLRRSAPQA